MLVFTGFYRVVLDFFRVLPSFTGISWVLLSFTGFYCVFHWFSINFTEIEDLTGFYWVLPSFAWFYWVLLGFTEFYWDLLGFTGFYRVLLGFTEFYPLLPSFTGFYWVLPSFTGFYGVLLGYTGFYRVLLDFFPHASALEYPSIIRILSALLIERRAVVAERVTEFLPGFPSGQPTTKKKREKNERKKR